MANIIRTLSKDPELVERQRKLIVKSAVKVFLQKSYHKATMRDIAEEAGMAPGNIYHYIGAKDDILHLLCMQASDSIDQMKNKLKQLKGKNTAEILEQGIRLFLKGIDDTAQSHLFYNREIQNFSHEDRNMLLSTASAYTKFFEGLIRKGIQTGEFKTDHPFLLAHNIFFICEDWALRRWNLKQGGNFSMETYTEQQINLIMTMLASPGGGKKQSGKPT